MQSTDDGDPAAMLRDGQALIRKGQAMIRAAENMGAVLGDQPVTGGNRRLPVDYGALPGKSPEARAEALYMGRRIRDRLFPEGFFSEPVWDILLALFLAPRGDALEIDPVLVECNISRSTGVRYLDFLAQRGFVEDRSPGRDDPKLVALSPVGFRLLNQFFELTEGEGLQPRAITRRRSAG